MDTIRLFLVEDHELVRAGLRRMLEMNPDMQVIGEAASGEEALAQIPPAKPDIVITDIKMPGMNGIELTRQLRQVYPSCDVLVLTLYSEFLDAAIEAGAVGYLLKDLRQEDLVNAIREVHRGKAAFHFSLEREQLPLLASGASRTQQLSERERSILSLVSGGFNTRQIADQLAFSETTIKRTLRLLFGKMGVRNRSEAVAEAMKRNLL